MKLIRRVEPHSSSAHPEPAAQSEPQPQGSAVSRPWRISLRPRAILQVFCLAASFSIGLVWALNNWRLAAWRNQFPPVAWKSFTSAPHVLFWDALSLNHVLITVGIDHEYAAASVLIPSPGTEREVLERSGRDVFKLFMSWRFDRGIWGPIVRQGPLRPGSTPVPRLLIRCPLWVLWIGFSAIPGLSGICWYVRRGVRVRKRLCLKCGYSLYGAPSEVCPECGTRVRRQAG